MLVVICSAAIYVCLGGLLVDIVGAWLIKDRPNVPFWLAGLLCPYWLYVVVHIWWWGPHGWPMYRENRIEEIKDEERSQ